MSVAQWLMLWIALAASSTVSAEGLLDAPSFERLRPASVSQGPRSLPTLSRHVDPQVEPATFERVENAKPMLPDFVPVATTPPLATASKEKKPPVSETLVPETVKKNTLRGLRLGESPKQPPLSSERPASAWSEMVTWRPSSNQIVSTGSGLAAVLGLVMIAAWIAKKSMPRSARPLPNDVVEVLGRVVLGGKQTAQLVKLGSKLLLVSVTPDGAETLTEITDQAEVQRLVQLSEESLGRGSSAEFERVFQQMASEPAAPGFLGNEADATGPHHYDAQRLAAAYSNTPGGRGHG